MAIQQIEQQIEALPPVEQVMMLERILSHLKMLLTAQSGSATPRIECKKVTEKLNGLYQDEASGLDVHLLNAQLASICRDDWQ